MSEPTKASDVQSRVQKMPKWLREWYATTLAVVLTEVPAGGPPTQKTQMEIAESIAFKLAVREYKRAEQNKEAFSNAMGLIMAATEEFEFEAGTETKFRVVVQPADGQGTLSMTIAPPTQLPEGK